ncbi:PucR family transcriptional regulator [Pseudomonas sp. GD03746]|uniref:PucR family transcriptional regulator n=1 Tax=Pseudomonas sp. GD03746 TaxID=2975378 RepID=UPI002447D209|nr:PucR family transcriptional regulator [Pseudomonas sp. GD03746]MDH1574260.1 PucR family transcriptional regulator ligand-binding domain-containing protein [Pseudomonas sp. GD03746]HEK1689289.1 PucR family transcriptional regulator ligand-binding domain-containing protein [Pseudomonas putida]HEN8710875.1 PucR family transcriptional regulator ligand-binding domain-containing protein [Pseudomonas putida]HEN8715944.1 PucR family transcriptional regulator ligand-binding domain-containing protein 
MLTVQNLIAIDPLKLQVAAGMAGIGRTITWAHTVDLPDPWRWVSPGDLVMTTGVGLPKTSQEQVEWLEQLVQSTPSALVIAPRQDAPDLTQALLEAADRLHFPVLRASFQLEFVKLSHQVIESVLQAQRERFNASERLFQTYAEALRKQPEMAGRLSILATALGMSLAIEDAVSGLKIVEAQGVSSEDVDHIERIPIGGRARANLIISGSARRTADDSILVRSLAGLLGVELERLMIQRDQQREEGESLLRSLLDGTTEFSLALPVLERHGLTGTLVSLAIMPGPAGPWSIDNIHHCPSLCALTPLLFVESGLLMALSRNQPSIFEELRTNLGVGTVIGVSGPISAATGLQESFRQSRLALIQAQEIVKEILAYGEAETGLVMAPKSMPEARALVGRYLGPLIEHDRTQGAALLTTLITFLQNDGNWKATAFDLDVHRQTLVYRLKLVEQLTGLKPTTTSGIARFWIAIQAGKNTKLID